MSLPTEYWKVYYVNKHYFLCVPHNSFLRAHDLFMQDFGVHFVKIGN